MLCIDLLLYFIQVIHQTQAMIEMYVIMIYWRTKLNYGGME